MKFPKLIQRRYCYLPSWPLLLLITVLVVAVCLVLFRNLACFLAFNSPVPSRYLIVEGWLPKSALAQALTEFNNGKYALLVTSGGPNYSDCVSENMSYAESAGFELIRMGASKDKVLSVSAPASAQDRTFLSAVMVRDKLESLNLPVESINIFTGDVHARRTFLLYQQAFRDSQIQIGVISTLPAHFKIGAWWESSEGAKSVVTEFIGWVWTELFFYPPVVSSHSEIWGDLDISRVL